jgi:outer membrane protein insertion porin family
VLGDVGFSAVRDSRDDPVQPKRGNYLTLGTRLFAEPFLSEETFTKTTLSDSQLLSFGRGSTFVTSVRIGIADPYGSTEIVPLAERFFAGGNSTVRGFPRDELGPVENGVAIGGEGMLVLNQELRFPLRGALRGTLFYDAGNVWRELGEFALDDMRHVLGVGIRYETPIGPLRVEYGHKLDREPGESAGELFFSIGDAF